MSNTLTVVGHPLIPGLAGRIFKLFDAAAPKCPIQDSLLQLAPGFIQIMAALMDHDFRNRQAEAIASQPAAPSVAGIGGMPDSCYMWRKDSPYAVSRREVMMPRKPA